MRKHNITTDLAKHFCVYVQIVLDFEDDNGKQYFQRRFVTEVEYYPSKVFYYKQGHKAHDFESINNAIEFCMALAVNGYCAYPVLMPDWNASELMNSNKYLEYSYSDNMKEYDENENEIKGETK